MSVTAVAAPTLCAPLAPPRARPDTPLSPHRLPHWYARGWRLWRRAPVMTTLGFVGALALEVLLASIPGVGILAAKLEGGIVGAGLLLGFAAVACGGRLRLGHLVAGFRQRWFMPVFGLSLLTVAIITAVPLLATAAVYGPDVFRLAFGHLPALDRLPGCRSLLIVTTSLTATAIMFAAPLVVLEGVGPWRATLRSLRLMARAPLTFATFGLVNSAIIVATLAVHALLWPVVGGWMVAVGFAAYQDLRRFL